MRFAYPDGTDELRSRAAIQPKQAIRLGCTGANSACRKSDDFCCGRSIDMGEIRLTLRFIILSGELRWKTRSGLDGRPEFADSEYKRGGCEHTVRVDVSAAAI